MAMARLAFRNLNQKLSSSPSRLLKRFISTTPVTDTATESDNKQQEGGKQVSVSNNKSSSKNFPRRRGRRNLWRGTDRDFLPGTDFFPSGLGNALFQATDNINRLFETLDNFRPIARVKEDDGVYKLRFDVPGLSKEEVKITVDDGVLTIKGEHKEEQEEGSSYGYYNTSLALPDDAKIDDIKAELKDGVLSITIPKTEKIEKDVKEVEIH